MKTYNITDVENIPTIDADSKTFTIRDDHGDGRTIDITGFWVMPNNKLGIDIGEKLHCINDVIVEDNTIALSSWSIGGNYMPGTTEYIGNGNNTPSARVTFDSMEELVTYAKERTL